MDRRAERRVARFQAAVAGVGTREELLQLLTAAARAGSVAAMKTLLDELRRDGHEGSEIPGIIDELARKREKDAGKS